MLATVISHPKRGKERKNLKGGEEEGGSSQEKNKKIWGPLPNPRSAWDCGETVEVRTEGSEGSGKAEMGGALGTMGRAGRGWTKLEGGWTVDKTQEDQGGERRQNGGEPKQMVKPGLGWRSVGRWVVRRAAKTAGDACIAMLAEQEEEKEEVWGER